MTTIHHDRANMLRHLARRCPYGSLAADMRQEARRVDRRAGKGLWAKLRKAIGA